jgi:hypothetical protein
MKVWGTVRELGLLALVIRLTVNLNPHLTKVNHRLANWISSCWWMGCIIQDYVLSKSRRPPCVLVTPDVGYILFVGGDDTDSRYMCLSRVNSDSSFEELLVLIYFCFLFFFFFKIVASKDPGPIIPHSGITCTWMLSRSLRHTCLNVSNSICQVVTCGWVFVSTSANVETA